MIPKPAQTADSTPSRSLISQAPNCISIAIAKITKIPAAIATTEPLAR